MKQIWNKLADKQKPLLLFGLAVVVALVVTVLIYGLAQADDSDPGAGAGNTDRRRRRRGSSLGHVDHGPDGQDHDLP